MLRTLNLHENNVKNLLINCKIKIVYKRIRETTFNYMKWIHWFFWILLNFFQKFPYNFEILKTNLKNKSKIRQSLFD